MLPSSRKDSHGGKYLAENIAGILGSFCVVILVTCTAEASCLMGEEIRYQNPCLHFTSLARDQIPILYATIIFLSF